MHNRACYYVTCNCQSALCVCQFAFPFLIGGGSSPILHRAEPREGERESIKREAKWELLPPLCLWSTPMSWECLLNKRNCLFPLESIWYFVEVNQPDRNMWPMKKVGEKSHHVALVQSHVPSHGYSSKGSNHHQCKDSRKKQKKNILRTDKNWLRSTPNQICDEDSLWIS